MSLDLTFCISAQTIPWICQLQQFLQQLFCPTNTDLPPDGDGHGPPDGGGIGSPDVDGIGSPDGGGYDSVYGDHRIVGGIAVEISEAPYILSIQIFGRHYCAAVIISPSWALSAANCFPKHYSISHIRLRGGAEEVPGYGYKYNLSKVYIHPEYSMKYQIPKNDIAAIKPGIKFEYVENKIQSISMHPMGEILTAGEMGTIFGWGAQKENHYPLLRILEKANVVIVRTDPECQRYINYQEGQFCAGFLEGGVGHCHGDEGGPFIYKNRLSGIASWSLGCARPKSPAAYTDIRYYRHWIKKTTNL